MKTTTLFVLLFATTIAYSQKKKEQKSCCAVENTTESTVSSFSLGDMSEVPNVTLINQDGEKVKFHDLIKDKVVALNFIFTTCKTICPPMGANFVHLKDLMKDRVASSELVMLTISIDPGTDTPERLTAWSEKFEPGEGWTLLTGKPKDVNSLLKKLEVYTALKEEHAPIVLMGHEGKGNWVRANGLADPEELAATLNQFFESDEAPSNDQGSVISQDEKYFTNVVLLDQNGNEQELFSNLMKDKVVIINPFFSECTGVCPVMNTNLQKIQEHLGDKLGKEVNILSLTVDYETDQPDVLSTYAEGYGAKEGWYFLTGDEENIKLALHKLGKTVKNREAHDSIFLVGNLNTGLWKKVNGLAKIADIIQQVDSVLYDEIN